MMAMMKEKSPEGGTQKDGEETNRAEANDAAISANIMDIDDRKQNKF